MRKLALALVVSTLFGLNSCQSFGWSGQDRELTQEQQARGLVSVSSLAADYETQTYYRGVRRRMDGISNSLGRDLGRISSFIDRSFFNYSASDPETNHPTNTSLLDHVGRFALSNTVSHMPLVDDIVRR